MKLLTNKTFMDKLATSHYVASLEFHDLSTCVSRNAFTSICRLDGLTALRLEVDGLFGHQSGALLEAVPPDISQLTDLKVNLCRHVNYIN